jgi:hypothetical protein
MSRFQITHGLRNLFNSIGLDLFFISFSFLSTNPPSIFIFYDLVHYRSFVDGEAANKDDELSYTGVNGADWCIAGFQLPVCSIYLREYDSGC